MKSYINIPLFGLCAILLCTFLTTNHVLAGGQMTISPANPDPDIPGSKHKFVYTIDPGETKNGAALARNLTNEEISLKVYPVDAITTSAGAFALKSLDNKQTGFGKWTSLTVDEITLEPRGTKKIDFEMNVPKNIAPGEYAGGIVVETIPNKNGSGAGAIVATRVGVRFYITISGKVITDFSWDDYSYQKTPEGKHAVHFQFSNDGNVSMLAKGKINIKSGAKTLDELDVELGTLFPGDTITPKVVWDDQPFMGSFDVETTVTSQRQSVSGEKFDPETETKTLSFQVIPWILIGGVILVIICFVLFFVWLRKRKKQLTPHTVLPGEDLMTILQKFGITNKQMQVINVNQLTPPYQLFANQQILLPITQKKYNQMQQKMFLQGQMMMSAASQVPNQPYPNNTPSQTPPSQMNAYEQAPYTPTNTAINPPVNPPINPNPAL